jgi:hypothetical protein
MWTICVTPHKDKDSISVEHGRRQICWLVPQYIPERMPGPPDPPFVTHPDLDAEKAKHLQVLATIDQFAEQLPADLSRDIQRSVATHMQSMSQKFGPGIELHRRGKKASQGA